MEINLNSSLDRDYNEVSKAATSSKEKIYYLTKRMIDIVGAFVGIVLLFPVMLLIYLSYLFEKERGSPLFKQKRIGLNGKVFNIFKFRTMVINAEEKLKSDPVLYKKYIENNYKLEPHEDPRITRMGQFLRRTSLDELPQLFNVLKGDMSLVGPRPVVTEELAEYKNKISVFLSVKPGITGYWQVSGRSNVGYPERVDIELSYIYNKSLLLDMKIIIKTIVKVLNRDGAY